MGKEMNKAEAKGDSATPENPFEKVNTMTILKPKTTPIETFVYRGFDDLEKLIKYIGNRPTLNPDLSLQFKKAVVKPNSVITRNAFGEVSQVMTFEEAATRYDIAATTEFQPDRDTNKVQAKPVKERKPRNK